MIHLLLNSGKWLQHPRCILPPRFEAAIRSHLVKGDGSILSSCNTYHIQTDATDAGATFRFFKDEYPISICTGTWSDRFAKVYWGQIEAAYYNLTDVYPATSWAKCPPKIPGFSPWLTTLLLPGYFMKVQPGSPDVLFLNICEVVLFEEAYKLARSNVKIGIRQGSPP